MTQLLDVKLGRLKKYLKEKDIDLVSNISIPKKKLHEAIEETIGFNEETKKTYIKILERKKYISKDPEIPENWKIHWNE